MGPGLGAGRTSGGRELLAPRHRCSRSPIDQLPRPADAAILVPERRSQSHLSLRIFWSEGFGKAMHFRRAAEDGGGGCGLRARAGREEEDRYEPGGYMTTEGGIL